ncbi:unnamed protein product, partial [Cyprideis torosa]
MLLELRKEYVAQSYYNNPLKVKIEEHYSRASEGGVGSAKASGNYAASFYPTILAKEEGFDQIIWTDAATHTKIEEAEAHRKGDLLEAFGCGTAVVIHHLSAIAYKDELMEIKPLDDEDSIGLKLKRQLIDIQYNNSPDPFGWR